MRLELSPPPDLKGRRILVTGGSLGFGRAMALAFLEDGARVAVCARDAAALAPLEARGALAVAADVSKPEDVDRLMSAVRARFGGLDAVINNAAVLKLGRLLEQDLEDWRLTLDVNVTGPLLVSRAAARLLESGSIVNVSSGLARFALEPYHAYCVSKAALEMLTKALAAELQGRAVVNTLDPGVARTRMNPSAAQSPESVVAAARALAALAPGGPTGLTFKKDGSAQD